MFEYILVFVILLVASLGFYLFYERFVQSPDQEQSDQYVLALRDLLDGRPEEAFAKLRQVVADDSSNIDAYIRLGRIMRDHGKADRALQVHRDLTLRPDLSRNHKITILSELHDDYVRLDDLPMAEAALKEWISLSSRDKIAHEKLLALLEKAQRWEEAYDTAAAILKLDANKSKKSLAQFKLRMADQFNGQREFHKARLAYKDAIGLDPSLSQAYLAMGDSYAQQDRFEDAVNTWNRLIQEIPADGHLAIDRLKKTLFDLGRFGDIVDTCRKILDHSAHNIQARLTLAGFYQKKGDLDQAEEILTQIVDDAPTDFDSNLQLIRLYLEKGEQRKLGKLFRTLDTRRGLVSEKKAAGQKPAAVKQ